MLGPQGQVLVIYFAMLPLQVVCQLVDVAVCPNPTLRVCLAEQMALQLQHTLELVFDILSGNIVGTAALLLLLYAFLFLPTW